MPAETFDWSLDDKFLNRKEELAQLRRWWAGDARDLIALYGRRRVGKSWLFRAFAQGKPAVVLVAGAGASGPQMRHFADRLEAPLGLRPEIASVPELFRILYRLGARRRTLAVIDEFPYLLPSARQERREVLIGIQAVIEEERDSSKTKLVVCGSQIGAMEKLMAEESPLHGRLQRLFVAPLGPEECVPFIAAEGPRDWIERYSVAGGMPLYLDELGRGRALRESLEANVLNPLGSLFEEPPFVLQQELQRPATYFSLLEEIASGPRALGDLASALGTASTSLTEYLRILREMRIVERELPITSGPKASGYRYRLSDGFFRFWFRFVRPFAAELETGLKPADLWAAEIGPALADHIAPAFEALCRRWVRTRLGDRASRVGSWWGPALNELRASGERADEEIDVVGMSRGRVTVVGECKWTAKPISVSLLGEVERLKLPALVQSGAKPAKGGPLIVFFSRGGFTAGLRNVAAERDDLLLVDLADLIPC